MMASRISWKWDPKRCLVEVVVVGGGGGGAGAGGGAGGGAVAPVAPVVRPVARHRNLHVRVCVGLPTALNVDINLSQL